MVLVPVSVPHRNSLVPPLDGRRQGKENILDFSSTWIGLDGFRTAGFPSVSVLLIDSSIVENYAIICWSILC